MQKTTNFAFSFVLLLLSRNMYFWDENQVKYKDLEEIKQSLNWKDIGPTRKML
jgi:hypothetical protein